MLCISIYLSIFRQIYLANKIGEKPEAGVPPAHTIYLICCGRGVQEPPETSVR